MIPESVQEIIRDKGGIRLDVGCGENKQEGFVGIDKRPLGTVDIVHDLETFPWPLPDECCLVIVASDFVEHIKPWLTIQLMDEFWRIMKPGGQLAIFTPYAGSPAFWQDPTHCNGFNEVTFDYFDPDRYLYGLYRPKPWRIANGFPIWQVTGTLEIMLTKLPLENEEPPPLGINIDERVGSKEVIG